MHLHILRQEDSLPWPMANREHVFLSFTQPVVQSNGEVVWYHIEQTLTDFPGYQPKRGNVLTTKFISLMFRDVPGQPGKCFATLVAEVDPAGNIPKSIINLKIGDAREFFADLTKAVKKDPGASALVGLRKTLAGWDEQQAAEAAEAAATAAAAAAEAEAEAEAVRLESCCSRICNVWLRAAPILDLLAFPATTPTESSNAVKSNGPRWRPASDGVVVVVVAAAAVDVVVVVAS